jgi:N-methylhydantoinase A
VYYDSRSAYVMLTAEQAPQIAAVFEEMEARLRARAGIAPGTGTVRRSFDGRLFGQSWETPFVEVPPGPIGPQTIPALIERFHAAYERRYGNRFDRIPVQGVSYRVELVIPAEKISFDEREPAGGPVHAPAPRRYLELHHLEDGPIAAAEHDRESLPAGSRIAGPAVIRESMSTTLVCPGQVARVGRLGELVIERA